MKVTLEVDFSRAGEMAVQAIGDGKLLETVLAVLELLKKFGVIK